MNAINGMIGKLIALALVSALWSGCDGNKRDVAVTPTPAAERQVSDVA
jgi:hypothetical protein